MAKIQFDLPTGDTEAGVVDRVGAFEKGFKLAKLTAYGQTSFNDNIYNKTMQTILTSFSDYKEYEDDYAAFAGLDERRKETYIDALNDNLYTLDENKQLTNGEGAPSWQKWGLLDKSALRGFLLAELNGFNPMSFDNIYTDLAMKEKEKLDKIDIEDTSSNKVMGVLGSVGGLVGDIYLIPEILGTIPLARGVTVAKGMGKAMLQEAPFAGFGATGRAFEKRKHIDHMTNEEYTDSDMVKDILIDTGAAALLRSFGSAIADNYTLWRGLKGITNEADRDIVTKFIKDRQFILTKDVRTSRQILGKVEADIEAGKNVDISEHTTIEISTKTDPKIEEINIFDEMQQEFPTDPKIEQDLVKEIDEIMPDSDILLKQEEDELLREFSTHPDIEAILKEVELLETGLKAPDTETRISAIQEHPRLEEALQSGRERLAKALQSPRKLIQKGTVIHDVDKFAGENKTFRIPASYEKNYEFGFVLTKSDVKKIDKGDTSPELLEKIERDLDVLDNDPNYQLLKEAVGDGMYMEDGIVFKADGTELFAKGLDNLIAGGLVGVEVDENGNITLDPAKFVLGMVGLSAVKRVANMNIFKEALSELPEATNRLVKKATGVNILSSIVSDPTALKNLRAIETKIKKDHLETLVITDSKGKEIFKKGGGENSVHIEKYERELIKEYQDNTIMTHNHPTGASFSIEDVLFGISNDLSEIRAIAHTNKSGDFIYEMSGLNDIKNKYPKSSDLKARYDEIYKSKMDYYEPKALANNKARLPEIHQAHTHWAMDKLMNEIPGAVYLRTRIKPNIVDTPTKLVDDILTRSVSSNQRFKQNIKNMRQKYDIKLSNKELNEMLKEGIILTYKKDFTMKKFLKNQDNYLKELKELPEKKQKELKIRQEKSAVREKEYDVFLKEQKENIKKLDSLVAGLDSDKIEVISYTISRKSNSRYLKVKVNDNIKTIRFSDHFTDYGGGSELMNFRTGALKKEDFEKKIIENLLEEI